MKTVLRVVFMSVMCAVIVGVAFAENSKPKGVLRIGVGMPYGGIGLNYEQPLYERLSMFAGLGYNGVTKGGWAAGAKIYINRNHGRNIRFYVIGQYSTPRFESVQGGKGIHADSKVGSLIGLGFGKRAWQLDFFYIEGVTYFGGIGWGISQRKN